MNPNYTWQFFTTTETAWAGMLELCHGAKKSIDLEQYIFGRDGRVERIFADAFLKQARAGVKIRLLLDTVGSFSFYRSPLCAELQAAGIDILFHHGITRPFMKRLFPFFLRDHRKLLVVDGEVANIGGVIIEEQARGWRDTAVSIRGKVAAELQMAFDTAWERGKKMRFVGPVISSNPRSEFSIAGNSFHLHHKALYRSFLRSIVGAKKRISITTPYLSPGYEFRRALYYALKKGVEIRILIPQVSDNFFADWLSRHYAANLRRHGVRIFFYTPTVLHTKSIVVDDNWASIGSCNFDWFSFWMNYELNLNSTNPVFVRELSEQFTTDLEQSIEMPALEKDSVK